MKQNRSKLVRSAVVVVIAGAILYAIMSVIDNIGLVYSSVAAAWSYISRILRPVLIGFIFAFILYRPAEAIGRLLAKMKFFAQRKRGAHVLGVFITFILFLGLLAAFLYMMIPSVIESVASITKDLPQKISEVDDFLLNLSRNETVSQMMSFVGIDTENVGSIGEIVSEFWTEITTVVQGLTNFLFGFIVDTGVFLYNFVLGLFFMIYMLIFKKQIKRQLARISKAVLKGVHYKMAFAYRVADDMFYKFLAGKGICSIAVGVVTLIVCSILGFKYTPLISLIIMITNMVPTFGPLIGAVPTVLLSMMTAPVYGLYMLIIIIGVQIVDGNILGPRVLGDSLGINGFWIIFSIVVLGALFGVVGMLAAAPLFVLLRILIKDWLVKRDAHYVKETPVIEYRKSLGRFKKWTAKKTRKQAKPQKS